MYNWSNNEHIGYILINLIKGLKQLNRSRQRIWQELGGPKVAETSH